ncbi:MAG: hypothetical protein Q8S73_09480 [Deltaproteobacteria bacterium]|nr:hypothetical protein [Myxococcales bacterium]MDP3214323.1 hypothetical protein [Deltaproteobacteria bacterium]
MEAEPPPPTTTTLIVLTPAGTMNGPELRKIISPLTPLTQVPDAHDVPVSHAWPQPPQFAESVAVFTHTPAHRVVAPAHPGTSVDGTSATPSSVGATGASTATSGAPASGKPTSTWATSAGAPASTPASAPPAQTQAANVPDAVHVCAPLRPSGHAQGAEAPVTQEFELHPSRTAKATPRTPTHLIMAPTIAP